MNRPAIFSRYRGDMEKALRRTLDAHDSPLYDMIRYHMGWIDEQGSPLEGTPGKALRPCLCLLACEAVCGDHARAIPAATALELAHNYSLIHDDIQDNDAERRHRPTVWKIWGVAQAINAGTAAKIIASLALRRYTAMGFEPVKTLDLLLLLEEATLTIIEGQYLDIQFESRTNIALEEYRAMIEKKTAALMAASLKAGAMAGCDNAALIEKFHGLGMALGLAFQIRDDILGIWGSSEATGKSTSSDIAKKKKTLPIVHLFAAASPPARKTLASIYADEGIEDGDIETVLKLLDEAGSRAYAEGLVEQYGNACHEIIESLAMDDYYRRDLHELTGFLSRRDR